MPRHPSTRLLFATVLKAGAVGFLVMPVAGTVTKPFLGWHVWQYGKRVAALVITAPNAFHLLCQALLLAWLAATPLVWLLLRRPSAPHLLVGAGYGCLYYAATNLVALPLLFGDPFPWQQGVAYWAQPLVVHIAFGVAAAWVARRSLPDPGATPAPGIHP